MTHKLPLCIQQIMVFLENTSTTIASTCQLFCGLPVTWPGEVHLHFIRYNTIHWSFIYKFAPVIITGLYWTIVGMQVFFSNHSLNRSCLATWKEVYSHHKNCERISQVRSLYDFSKVQNIPEFKVWIMWFFSINKQVYCTQSKAQAMGWCGFIQY